MATLSRDVKTYRSGGVRVRDARHVHNGPDICDKPAAPKRTRLWCRGKIGREHRLVVGDEKSLGKAAYSFSKGTLVRYCAVCGKELERWSPPELMTVVDARGDSRHELFSWSGPMPDWVREYLEANGKQVA